MNKMQVIMLNTGVKSNFLQEMFGGILNIS